MYSLFISPFVLISVQRSVENSDCNDEYYVTVTSIALDPERCFAVKSTKSDVSRRFSPPSRIIEVIRRASSNREGRRRGSNSLACALLRAYIHIMSRSERREGSRVLRAVIIVRLEKLHRNPRTARGELLFGEAIPATLNNPAASEAYYYGRRPGQFIPGSFPDLLPRQFCSKNRRLAGPKIGAALNRASRRPRVNFPLTFSAGFESAPGGAYLRAQSVKRNVARDGTSRLCQMRTKQHVGRPGGNADHAC